MKRAIGIGCMCVGVLLLLSAAVLYRYNSDEEARAARATEYFLPQLIETALNSDGEEENTLEDQTGETVQTHPNEISPCEKEMTVVQIDGYGFIGYLTVPSLGLELPVMSETDAKRLRIAPCRYSGSTKTGDLVIGAHNYQRHFGRLSELPIGEDILFTDMNGVVRRYRVADIEILEPTAVQDLTAGEYALTLYTCTYGGASRVTVRCDCANG